MSIKIDMNVCRVCRACLQSEQGTDIYTTGDILEKFSFTTLVHAKKNDGLPEKLCKKCLMRLQIAYEFKKQAQDSDRNIRSFILGVKKQFQQVTSSSIVNKTQKSIAKTEIIDDGSIENVKDSNDDLYVEMLMYDEEGAYGVDDKSQTISVRKDLNPSLVEILGGNATGSNPNEIIDVLQENMVDDNYDEPPQHMVEYNEEEVDLDQGYFIENVEGDPFEQKPESFDDEEHQLGAEYLEQDEEVFEITDGRKKIFHKRRNRKTSDRQSSELETLDHHCAKCDKFFSTKTNLTRHELTHNGVKPYICNICGQGFTQNGSLKSHMYIHTGERPYKCSECDKAFTQSKSLTFHMRRHTGEKPFQCELCEMRFRQKDGLKRHEAAKHSDLPISPFFCDICGKKLLSKYSLIIHRKKHSEIEKPNDGSSQESDGQSKEPKLKRGSPTKKKQKQDESSYAEEDAVKKENDKSMDETNETVDEWEIFACECCEQTFGTADELQSHSESHSENPKNVSSA